ncbi:unnamed protein product [Lampetra planeri]
MRSLPPSEFSSGDRALEGNVVDHATPCLFCLEHAEPLAVTAVTEIEYNRRPLKIQCPNEGARWDIRRRLRDGAVKAEEEEAVVVETGVIVPGRVAANSGDHDPDNGSGLSGGVVDERYPKKSTL